MKEQLSVEFGKIACSFGQNQNVITPLDFKKVVNSELPMFFGNQQHDAAEFINFVLDKMNEEMNRAAV